VAMEQNFAAVPMRKPSRGTQVSHSSSSISGVTDLQIRRIVAALRKGQRERAIADAEGIAERIVSKVRVIYIDNIESKAMLIAQDRDEEDVEKLQADSERRERRRAQLRQLFQQKDRSDFEELKEAS
jgi:hypothetical protein